eukprot:CAMPEP_0183598166 /NCGR_PEP_ID=MMETSP0371-20130417/178194_1 /TAXON_ID=268820 /ORGANISM="Peridinium aciculiferum, Strain PAER-2" /LENGTH=227 /DNA_ID=CAMNT_0025810189 /DNA_START=1 /DNA_END=680 /DNA_ORIENTATION=+
MPPHGLPPRTRIGAGSGAGRVAWAPLALRAAAEPEGDVGGEPMRCPTTRPDSKYAAGFDPKLHFAVVGTLRPSVAAAAALGLALRALCLELKEASRTLLALAPDVPRQPLQGDSLPACFEAALRSAICLLARVHAEEIAPAAALFEERCGGRAKDWAEALERPRSRCRRNIGARERPGHAPPRGPTPEEVAALPSSSQRALLRALAEAARLGASAALPVHERLAAHL